MLKINTRVFFQPSGGFSFVCVTNEQFNVVLDDFRFVKRKKEREESSYRLFGALDSLYDAFVV